MYNIVFPRKNTVDNTLQYLKKGLISNRVVTIKEIVYFKCKKVMKKFMQLNT